MISFFLLETSSLDPDPVCPSCSPDMPPSYIPEMVFVITLQVVFILSRVISHFLDLMPSFFFFFDLILCFHRTYSVVPDNEWMGSKNFETIHFWNIILLWYLKWFLAASASPENFWEIQILKPHPRPTESETPGLKAQQQLPSRWI